MLPMGTIMAACMFLGVAFATRLPGIKRIQKLPKSIITSVSFIVFAAGMWNVFWYGVQNVGLFWGNAALVSGGLMLLTSGYISFSNRLPLFLLNIRSIIVLFLFCSALLYGITIYNM